MGKVSKQGEGREEGKLKVFPSQAGSDPDTGSPTRWLFVVKTLDKPGALTAVASVFSNRGVSLQMILGSTLSAQQEGTSTLFFCFEASETKMEILQRAVARLSKVLSVQSYSYASPQLRAAALARVPRTSGTLPEEGVEILRIAATEEEETLLMFGSPFQVERWLATLRESCPLPEVTFVVLPV